MPFFYKLTLIILLISATFAGFSTPKTTHAASYTAVQSGNWNDPATWGGVIPTSADDVTIPAGITVTIPNGLNITRDKLTTISGTLDNYGTFNNNFNELNNQGIFANYGTINNSVGNRIGNYNIFNNYGTFNNNGGISNDQGYVFTNRATGSINNTASIDSSGTFINNGTITSQSTGRIEVSGKITNNETLDSSGEIFISGQFINNSQVTNGINGTFEVYGILTNNAILNNNGLIYINSLGKIDNYNVLYNEGTIENSGVFNNNEMLVNTGSFTNNGTINNQGIIDNQEIISNQGVIYNYCGGKIIGNPVTGSPVITIATASSPGLIAPLHRTHTSDTTPRFQWQSVNGAKSYRLMVYVTDRSFVLKQRVFVNDYILTTPLVPNQYLWRVRTQDESCSTWSGWSKRNTLFVD